MPRTPPHTLDSAPAETRPTLEALQRRMGTLLCDHRQAAPTGGGKAAGLDADEMAAIRRGEPVDDPKLEALLAVARAATAGVGQVEGATWKTAQRSGWGDQELSEAFVHIALNLYTNYVNHYAGTELDLPAAPAVS